MKVLHVISGLTGGGAEAMLCKLAVALRAEGFASVVACLGPRGEAGKRLEAAGVEVHYLRLEKNPLFPLRFRRLTRLLRTAKPDLVQGWMLHGNLAALAARALSGSRAPVIWSVHQSLYTLRHESFVNAALIRLAARLSPFAHRIVYVSEVSARQHESLGFRAHKTRVLPIGFEARGFAPLPEEARAAARTALGLPPSGPLAGLAARNDPKKDPFNFLAAAALTAARVPEARFLLLGRGMDSGSLRAEARRLGVESRFTFLGEQADARPWIAALDVLVSASYTEAFPNVIGEAMAAGVPCVVTDVGDSARLLGEAGLVVAPRDAEALAAAMVRLFEASPAERAAIGALGRRRIEERFSIEAVARRYAGLYREA